MDTAIKTDPTILIIFGGSGDLTWRKLIPALYNLNLDGWLNEKFKIICIGRTEMSDEVFVGKVRDGVDNFSRRGKQ
jgi:glucose-6-phosphate 1-dehydrogenase